MTTMPHVEVAIDVGEPPAPPPPPPAVATPNPPASFAAIAVPLLLQLGLSGAIKILSPAAASSRYVVAFKMYASAVFLTFTMDMVLAICFVAVAYYGGRGGGGGFGKQAAAGVVMKTLMAVALAVSFATVGLATVLNILA